MICADILVEPILIWGLRGMVLTPRGEVEIRGKGEGSEPGDRGGRKRLPVRAVGNEAEARWFETPEGAGNG